MLMPSTITALRTRRYDFTWYVPGTIHRVENAPLNGGGRYSFQLPNVSRSIRLRGPIPLRRLQILIEHDPRPEWLNFNL